jgi:hypothetical protein
MCPAAPARFPVREGSGVATCHRVHHLTGKGSGVTTCPMAPDSPLSARGLWHHHVPRTTSPPLDREELRCRHVSYGSRPTSRCGRAPASPHAPWLLASEACQCVPKTPNVRLIMASPGMQSRQCIKYVQKKSYMAYD